MEFATVLVYIKSALVPLIIFGSLVLFTMIRGRRATTSLILGLYFALLISLKFPYYERLNEIFGRMASSATVSIIVFAVFTVIFSLLMDRLLFYRIDEGAFQGLGKKIFLSLLATILVMVYSYHVLPITNLVDPGVTASLLFSSNEYFFWWLIFPLFGLFFI